MDVSTQQATPRRIRLPHYAMGGPSADGTEFPYTDETGHLYIWAVATGRSRLIAEASPAAGSGHATSMSRDGDEVAYGWRLPDDAYELRVISSSGMTPRTLIPRQTAYEPVPVEWSRDGRSILCWLHQRNGTSDLVLLPTDGGASHLLQTLPSRELAHASTASFDLSGVTAPGPPTRIAPSAIGNHVAPSWSPDGRFLAFFTTSNTTPGATPKRTLTIKDTVSGALRLVPVPLLFVAGYTPRWAPDGRHVIILGRNEDREEAFGYFQVEVGTGDMIPVATVGMNAPAFSQYSRDGRHFFYVHPPRGLVALNLSTGEEQVAIARGQHSALGPFVIAPDGETIALVGTTQTNGRQVTTLQVQRLAGRPRELARAVAPAWVSLHAWTPDGQGLLFTRGSGTNPYKLWRISAQGSDLTDMHFSITPSPNPISLSPDGQQIAYTERVMQHELWITAGPVMAGR